MKIVEVVTDIINDDNVFKLDKRFKFNNHELIVAYADNSDYLISLTNLKKHSIYLFDNKYKKHVLLVKKDHFEKKFKVLYSDIVIQNNLELFVRRKQRRTFFNTIFYLLTLLIVFLNYLNIKNTSFKEGLLFLVSSVIVVASLFFLNALIVSVLYDKDKKKKMEQLIQTNPSLLKEIDEENKIKL